MDSDYFSPFQHLRHPRWNENATELKFIKSGFKISTFELLFSEL